MLLFGKNDRQNSKKIISFAKLDNSNLHKVNYLIQFFLFVCFFNWLSSRTNLPKSSSKIKRNKLKQYLFWVINYNMIILFVLIYCIYVSYFKNMILLVFLIYFILWIIYLWILYWPVPSILVFWKQRRRLKACPEHLIPPILFYFHKTIIKNHTHTHLYHIIWYILYAVH